jgi:hypothetical protein
MAKKNGVRVKSMSRRSASKEITRGRVTRNILAGALVLFVLLGAGAGLAYHSNRNAQSYDLSVIGNGIPTVVHMHNPQCPRCVQLLRNLRAATRDIDSNTLQVRIVDIRTTEGRQLANRYGVSNITLLVFDGAGEMRQILPGVREVAELRTTLAAYAERYR